MSYAILVARHLIVSGLVFVLSAAHVSAQDDGFMPLYKKVGPWDVRVDTTLGDGCFVIAFFEKDSALRLGINRVSGGAYIVFGNPNWRSLEPGKLYDLEVQFGNEEKWSGEASGFTFDPPEPQPFIWLSIDNSGTAEFFREFMQEHYVTVYYNNEPIDTLSLRGTYRASEVLFECQENINAATQDPFKASAPPPSDDPFAR